MWLSADATDTWRPSPSGRPGGQKRFSDLAIETALTLRLVFRLPLRQTEGFLRLVLFLMDVHLEAPDHTTLSRRSQHLAIELSRLPAKGPIDLIVDSTGLSIVGEGEWAAAKYGRRGKRGWRKLHFGVDRSSVIVAQALTAPTVDDAMPGVELIEAVDDDMASVTADAAYDTLAFYDTAGAHGATVVVPPNKTARVSRRRPRFERSRPDDQEGEAPRSAPVEEGVRLLSAGARGAGDAPRSRRGTTRRGGQTSTSGLDPDVPGAAAPGAPRRPHGLPSGHSHDAPGRPTDTPGNR